MEAKKAFFSRRPFFLRVVGKPAMHDMQSFHQNDVAAAESNDAHH